MKRNIFNDVYDIVEKIPAGKVATYGQIAYMLGCPGAARTVGFAMRAAPENRDLPCHRVVSKGGRLAPGDVFGGYERQRALLEAEGVAFEGDGTVDMEKCMWQR